MTARAYKVVGTIGWLVVPYVAAAVGAQFSARDYYAQLTRPEWAPPGWLFAPVWTLLYLMMGISAALVWQRQGFDRGRVALGLFVVQLVLNAAWSWIFFGMRMPGVALVEIITLWVLIVATVVAFWRARVVAGMLLFPYLAWVSFAVTLNYSIWRLNS